MSDEDLRSLERAAASDETARLKLAEALLRLKGAKPALEALRPLLEGETDTAGLARRRGLAIALSANLVEGRVAVAQTLAKIFGERLSSIDEVCEMIRETPPSATAVRVILVRALRGRSKRASIALAQELPASDPLRGILGAEGEVVI